MPWLVIAAGKLDLFDVSFNLLSLIQDPAALLDCSPYATTFSYNNVPGGYFSNSTLTQLNLNHNQLTGDIIELMNCIQIMTPKATSVDLSANYLSGVVCI